VKAPSPVSLLELDIDVRMHTLWSELADFDERLTHEQVGAFMRAAYGKGYADALTEPHEGQLCTDHGYRVPRRAA
jgi:hypothetical protein